MANISIESLYDLATVSAPTVSPCGNIIVYVKTILDKEKDGYVSNLFAYNQQTQETTQWTFGTDQNYAPLFAPVGEKLLFLSNRSGTTQAYVIECKLGGEAKAVTTGEKNVSKALWTPDGTGIIFARTTLDAEKTAKEKTDKVEPMILTEVYYRGDGLGYVDTDSHTQLFYQDLSKCSSCATQLTTLATNHNLCDIDPSGKKILFSHFLTPTNPKAREIALYEYDLTTKETIHITAMHDTGMFTYGTYSPDGKTIAVGGTAKKATSAAQPTVYFYDIASKTLTDVFGQKDIHITNHAVGDFTQKCTTPDLQWAPDGSRLYLLTSNHGRVGIYSITPDGVVATFSEELEVFADFTITADSGTIIAAITAPTQPADIFVIDIATKKCANISNANASILASYQLAEYKEATYTAADGGKVHGFVVIPAGLDENKKYPLIYNVHGGPHAMHAALFFHEAQVQAALGHVVLLVNPRGSIGYGQAHTNGVLGHYGEGDYTDLMTFLDGVIADNKFIDTDRLLMTGGSYGGFMTNWAIGHTDRFKAAVTQRSISNWTSMWGTSDIGYYFCEWELDADLFKDFQAYWDMSPLKYAENFKTPTLIIHSEEDHRCPMEQAEQLYSALHFFNVPTRFVRYPKSSHGLSREGIPSLRVSRLTELLNWFEKYGK
jgi:Dipeptidyl aminopeptidases/acylaminoacyl-peptidases